MHCSIPFSEEKKNKEESPWEEPGKLSPENFWYLYFKIVYSGAFSYTSKVLFAIKCRDRNRYMSSHGILGD